jgi:hypothetical protein
MALSNYSELQDTIGDYIFRPDAPIKSFISLAETDIRPFIKHYAMETEVTLTSAANAVTRPADFLEARRLFVDGILAKPVSAYGYDLKNGEIGYYQSGSTYKILPEQDEPRTVVLTYYQRLPALSDAKPTNWLLTDFSAVYLHASLARAYRWLKNPEEEAGEKQSLQEAFSQVAADNARAVNSGNPIELENRAWL